MYIVTTCGYMKNESEEEYLINQMNFHDVLSTKYSDLFLIKSKYQIQNNSKKLIEFTTILTV